MRCCVVAVVVLMAAGVQAAAPPGKTRALTKVEQRVVDRLDDQAERHENAARFEQALQLARQVADYRRQRQGARHSETIDANRKVEQLRRLAAIPLADRAEVQRGGDFNAQGMALLQKGEFAEGEKRFRDALRINEKVLGVRHPFTATSYAYVAHALRLRGKADQALPLFRKAVEVAEKALGRDDPQVASSYNNLAQCLKDLGKHDEALPLFRKALLSAERTYGPDHRSVAVSHNNIASCLQAQGKADEALPLYRQAVEFCERNLGPDHPDTGQASEGVASCLLDLGKHAQALPLFRKALSIAKTTRGPDHPDTAIACNSVARCLNGQGKAAEALPLYVEALRINEKALGADHPFTALAHNNVAGCLHDLGKPAEALPRYRQALAIQEKILGQEHPQTAAGYNNVAACLKSLGKLSEALPLFRKALAINEKALGADHPGTADNYRNVAACLDDRSGSSEAVSLYRRALRIDQQSLGSDHPDTALSYNELASCYWDCGRRHEAVRLLQQSLRGQEAARAARVYSGFDRARKTTGVSPRAALAVGLARLGQPRNAFAHAEASLARGLLDDLAGLSRDELSRAEELQFRLRRLEPALATLSAAGKTDAAREEYDRTRTEYVRLWREWSALYADASARAVLPLERIQKAIGSDAALVLWVEELRERWACIVRSEGAPVWKALRRDSDPTRGRQLYLALREPDSDDKKRQGLLAAFRAERFDPLRPHLKGVKRLFVVPTGHLAYIPAELLADDVPVSYIPSGSVLARIVAHHRILEASSMLAVGDPIFDKAPPPPPPTHGILIKTVLPNSQAARAGLEPGDVLLRVGSTRLESVENFDGVLSSLPAKVEVWRNGKTLAARIQSAPLGIVLDQRSVAAALRAWRREQEAVAQRGTGHKRLPGTRLEVEAISAMVKRSTSLLGSDASEQTLDDQIARGELKRYRLLHLATHGEIEEQNPDLSSLILAQDNLPDPARQVRAKQHSYNGRLTVERIRERWTLDADLVVLSACETGLGKDAKGDGLLGFAQAFLSRGARSVVLSRWKVDDTATSLLMIRFYENLLGKRKGVKPMGRAAALDEAKKWLRTLPRKEAERLATLQTGGVLRGSEGTEKTPGKVQKIEYKGDAPFAHPYYWAAWTLIGDPD